ncbi:MAG: hypothetical protein EZS28_030247, partial [Streblomastix strix]
ILPSQLAINVGVGIFQVINNYIGGRDIKIIGKSIAESQLQSINSIISPAFTVIGGNLNVQQFTIKQASSQQQYGGLIVIRGDGLIQIDYVMFQQLDQWIDQRSSVIYSTAGDVSVSNSQFEQCVYKNDVQMKMKSASIHTKDKSGIITITNTSYSIITTVGSDSPITQLMRTTNPLLYKDAVDFDGGAIFIEEAEQLTITLSNITNNQGWRTGGINIRKLAVPKIIINGCLFDRNVAKQNLVITDIFSKMQIGNDIILDHKYLRDDIATGITNTQSTSKPPLVGSYNQQYQYGVFDYLITTQAAAEYIYVSIQGDDTNGDGTEELPYRTVQNSTRVAQISLFDGTYEEREIQIGGRFVSIFGSSTGESEVIGNTTQVQRPENCIITNTKDTVDQLILILNGSLQLRSIKIILSNDQSEINFTTIELFGTAAVLSVSQCVFETKDKNIPILKQIIKAQIGAQVTFQSVAFEKIYEEDSAVFDLKVQLHDICMIIIR